MGVEGKAAAVQRSTIALGTSCLTAHSLRRLGLNPFPMPFDWLENSPSMVRHCLETDFRVLLDRSHYRSLTGKRGPNDPRVGCAHEYYHREHKLAFLFTHSDPTREADYRYLLSCVDRLRGVMGSNNPIVFVQIHHADGFAKQDFEATASLLDRLTRAPSLLQIVVTAPGTRLTLPIFSMIAERGEHTLYRMQPTSQMTGVDFFGPVDNEAVDGLIASYVRYGRRDFASADLVSGPASSALNLALENALLIAHIADRGDVKPDRDGWTGNRGSGLPVQGIRIQSRQALIKETLRYQVAETPDRFSTPGNADSFVGTRGEQRPIYGLRVMLPESAIEGFHVSMEVSFIDGSVKGPIFNECSLEFLSDSPLESIRLLISEK